MGIGGIVSGIIGGIADKTAGARDDRGGEGGREHTRHNTKGRRNSRQVRTRKKVRYLNVSALLPTGVFDTSRCVGEQLSIPHGQGGFGAPTVHTTRVLPDKWQV